MKRVIAFLVFASASVPALAENVWYDCGHSIQVLRDATIVLKDGRGVPAYYPTELYNNAGSAQDYVTADRQLIFSKRGSSAAIYDGNLNKIVSCSENYGTPYKPYPTPYNPNEWEGCSGCMNDGGFP